MPARRRASSPPSSAFALSAIDETPLFYELDGPPSGSPAVAAPAPPTAVLLDGIGCDGYVWKYLRASLTARGPVLHSHYRGHGRTPKPVDPDRIAIADLADDIATVMDDAGVAGGVLIGHSMGVQVALETARRHPDRIRGLVLVCGAPENPLKTFKGTAAFEAALPVVRRAVARAPRLASQVARLVLPTQLAFAVAGRLEINRDLIRMADFMPYLRGMAHVDMPYFLAMLAAASEHSARDFLPAIPVPTLVVAGGRDGFTPPSLSREMAEAIPGAELLEVEDGSHTAPLERPSLIDEAIVAFIARRVAR